MKKEDFYKWLHSTLAGFGSLALAIVLYFLILRFGEFRGLIGSTIRILTPFVYGGVMAFILKTPCNFFQDIFEKYFPEKLKKRSGFVAVVLVMILAMLLLYLFLAMVVPELFSSISRLTVALPRQITRLSDWITEQSKGDPVIQRYVTNIVNSVGESVRKWSQQDILPTLSNVMGGFAIGMSSVLGMLYNFCIGIIVCVYLLLDRKRFAQHGKAILYGIFKPETADMIHKEICFIDKTFIGFFSGKILDSAIVGLICYVFCLIMTFAAGFKHAMLISVIVGVTNIIPFFGPYIGMVPSALLILINSPANCVIFLIFVMILQQIDGNILGPHLLANSTGLSGFWVLFSITLFGGIFGFAGVLAGVPVFAVLYDMFRRWLRKRLAAHGKLEMLDE